MHGPPAERTSAVALRTQTAAATSCVEGMYLGPGLKTDYSLLRGSNTRDFPFRATTARYLLNARRLHVSSRHAQDGENPNSVAAGRTKGAVYMKSSAGRHTAGTPSEAASAFDRTATAACRVRMIDCSLQGSRPDQRLSCPLVLSSACAEHITSHRAAHHWGRKGLSIQHGHAPLPALVLGLAATVLWYI